MSENKKSLIEKSYEKLLALIQKWSEKRPDIRAVFVIGSRARKDHAADEWADLDVVIVTTQPQHYISDSKWISNFGRPLLTFIEPTATLEEKERRVLYEGMLDVDFAVFPQETIDGLLATETDARIKAQIATQLSRGIRIIIDKEGLAKNLESAAASAEMPPKKVPPQQEFFEVVNDFIYHAVFTAKHLKRGEVWWTITCLDCYLQQLLLKMIEWHATAMHEQNYNTWFRGRFLEEWADPKVVNSLRGTFAHYDIEDIERALWNIMNLFEELAREIAEKMNYRYPAKANQEARKWIASCLAQTLESESE